MSNDYYESLLEEGMLHEMGSANHEKNYLKAYQSYKEVPSHYKRGESHYRIGELLMVGDDFFKRNYNRARSRFEEAAFWGHGEARYALGQIYEQGLGVHVDYAVAKGYYHQAFDVGFMEAAKDIGIMFLRAPPGVLYDLSRVKIYLERFEEHYETDADVHMALGDYYRLTKHNGYSTKAIDRYKKAFELGEGLGCYWIGQIYEGVSSANLSTAVGWYQQGEILKDAKCMWRLAQLHVSGEIVKNDINAARILFVDAANKGCEEAKKELDQLDARIAKEKSNKADAVKTTDEAESDVKSKDTPAKPKDAEPSSNFQPLSWDRMRKSFEAHGAVFHEKISTQTSTSTAGPDEQLAKTIEMSTKHETNVPHLQVRSQINEQCLTNPFKPVLEDIDDRPSRGYKFKTKYDIRKQLKGIRASSPLPSFQMQELPTTIVQSSQAQKTLETTNKALLRQALSLTLKLNRLSTENEKSASIINSNNEDIARKFEQVEDSIDDKYKHVCQRLDVLEKVCVEKDKAIELLASKLDTQSRQLETLIRLVEKQ